MLPLCLCALLAATPPLPVALKAGAAELEPKVASDDQVTRVERQEPGGTPQVRAQPPLFWRREGNKLVPAR